jgi:hypothetical protein
MQLGLVFSGDLDVRLVLRHGPLFAGACRLKDIRDMALLQVARGRVAERILPDAQ